MATAAPENAESAIPARINESTTIRLSLETPTDSGSATL